MSCESCDDRRVSLPARRLFVVVLALLAVVEVVSALWLAWLNPVRGYDENVYLINSHHLRGFTALPYAAHRPPLFPLLLALFGDYARLVPGVAHIAGSAVFYLILRRLVSPWTALAGVLAFVMCGTLRWYNFVLLTETLSMLCLLLGVYAFVVGRPAAFGVAMALAAMAHWSMLSAALAGYCWYVGARRGRESRWFVAGFAGAAIPFLVGFTIAHGGPLAPVISNLATNLPGMEQGANDWAYYLRNVPQLPWA
ncbi:MAG: hypothetical protein ACE5EX_09255, partial [Phycisphaerae bacterium]